MMAIQPFDTDGIRSKLASDFDTDVSPKRCLGPSFTVQACCHAIMSACNQANMQTSHPAGWIASQLACRSAGQTTIPPAWKHAGWSDGQRAFLAA
jgi:hypothetical protein